MSISNSTKEQWDMKKIGTLLVFISLIFVGVGIYLALNPGELPARAVTGVGWVTPINKTIQSLGYALLGVGGMVFISGLIAAIRAK